MSGYLILNTYLNYIDMGKLGLRITRYRWIPLVTGLIAIGLGIWCLCSPVTSVPVMAYIFAGLLCVAGIFNFAFAYINSRIAPNWGWSLALGILDLVAGIWMLCLPEEELAVTFVIVLGIWLLCVAINAICETFVLSTTSIWWTIFSVFMLVITIYFAIVVISSPVVMAVTGWLYLGISLITYGIFRMAVYGNLRRIDKATHGLI